MVEPYPGSVISIQEHSEYYSGIPGEEGIIGREIAPLSINEIIPSGRGKWGRDEKTFPGKRSIPCNDGWWTLYIGHYEITLPIMHIPDNCFGKLWPRSTLLRMGLQPSRSALWDPGYKGAGVTYLTVPSIHVEIQSDVPMYVLVLTRLTDSKVETYDGNYQGEGT